MLGPLPPPASVFSPAPFLSIGSPFGARIFQCSRGVGKRSIGLLAVPPPKRAGRSPAVAGVAGGALAAGAGYVALVRGDSEGAMVAVIVGAEEITIAEVLRIHHRRQ